MVIDVSGKNTAIGQKSYHIFLFSFGTSAHSISWYYKTKNYPLTDYNLLSDSLNKDIDALYEGITFCMKLVNTTAFRKIGTKLPVCNSYQYLSKDYWYCYLRQLSVTVFHPVGSCPMGTDSSEGAVVDSNLRVFGLKDLRVAESSVFPLSSHTSADCAMIGEKVSDVIKLTY